MSTYDFGDGNGPVPAAQHINPDGSVGGWVADTASVDAYSIMDSVSVVYDTAKVFNSSLTTSSVCGSSYVSGYTPPGLSGVPLHLYSSQVYGNAQMYGYLSATGSSFYGSAYVDMSVPGSTTLSASNVSIEGSFNESHVYDNATVRGTGISIQYSSIYGNAALTNGDPVNATSQPLVEHSIIYGNAQIVSSSPTTNWLGITISGAVIYDNATIGGSLTLQGTYQAPVGLIYVYGYAQISENPFIHTSSNCNMRIYGYAKISGSPSVWAEYNDSAGNSVWIYGNSTIRGTANISGAAKIFGGVFSPTHDIYIANNFSPTISVLSAESATHHVITDTITLPDYASDIAVTPDSSYVYAITQIGKVYVVSTASLSVVNTITLDANSLQDGFISSGLAITPDGSKVYVVNEAGSSGSVSVIDTATNTVTATAAVASYPSGIAITPDGLHAYVTSPGEQTISVISTATNTTITSIAINGNPDHLAITPNGLYVYVVCDASNDVSVISTATNTLTATIAMGAFPNSIAITPDGSRVYVTISNLGTGVSVISTATNTITSTITVSYDPYGIAITPDGLYAYVANYFSSRITVIATATNTVTDTVLDTFGPLHVAIPAAPVRTSTQPIRTTVAASSSPTRVKLPTAKLHTPPNNPTTTTRTSDPFLVPL